MPRGPCDAQRDQEPNQGNGERGETGERRAMNRAALMMVRLPMTGYRRAIGVAEADLETRSVRTGCKLRRDGAGEYRMQHERVSRDPADKPARKTHAWSRRCHPCPSAIRRECSGSGGRRKKPGLCYIDTCSRRPSRTKPRSVIV